MQQGPTLLDRELWFPAHDSALTVPEGLLAIGGDLSPARLLLAYENGIFPWFEDGQPILWWSPPIRAIVLPENFVPSRSLKKLLCNARYRATLDLDFERVIRSCRNHRLDNGQETWITDTMIEAYLRLHDLGHAHAISCYLDDELIGGLYGLSIGNIFCGESMFSSASNGSKIAFSYLIQLCQRLGIELVDCQMPNPHLMSLGAQDISRADFLSLIQTAPDSPPDFQSHRGLLPTWQASFKEMPHG